MNRFPVDDPVNGQGTTEGCLRIFTADSTPAEGTRENLMADAPLLEMHPNPADRCIRFSLPEGSADIRVRIYDY